jgi:hypothetical protein
MMLMMVVAIVAMISAGLHGAESGSGVDRGTASRLRRRRG